MTRSLTSACTETPALPYGKRPGTENIPPEDFLKCLLGNIALTQVSM